MTAASCSHCFARPYTQGVLNRVEGLALAVGTASLVMASYSQSSRAQTLTWLMIMVTMIMLVLNFWFFGYFLKAMALVSCASRDF